MPWHRGAFSQVLDSALQKTAWRRPLDSGRVHKANWAVTAATKVSTPPAFSATSRLVAAMRATNEPLSRGGVGPAAGPGPIQPKCKSRRTARAGCTRLRSTTKVGPNETKRASSAALAGGPGLRLVCPSRHGYRLLAMLAE